jgi:hypothetical protein
MTPIGDELFPNGGVTNIGAWGGSSQASKSYFGGPVCQTIVAGDINGDCKVDFVDVTIMALHWCTELWPEQVPFELAVGDGAKWSDQYKGYDPDLPGYHIVGDIASVTLRARTDSPPGTLVLAIRTSPGMPAMLENFAFAAPCVMLAGEPFKEAGLTYFERPNSSMEWKVVPDIQTDTYFKFNAVGDEVHITLLPKAIELLDMECKISWIDWYR